MAEVKMDPSWKEVLQDEFVKSYWQTLTSEIRQEYTTKTVYPPAKDIFQAFNLCTFENVKVVIIGQDPYHGKNQANGLSFAVNDGVNIPPSLQNIFKEIKNDTGITPIQSGDLSRWAVQGVLLLNSVLTVVANSPASHAKKGWEEFTDAVVATLNEKKKHLVYLLWGKYAQAKGMIVNKQDNLVLTSGHPSPYSANLFFGHHHFTLCNAYLEEHGMTPIDWK